MQAQIVQIQGSSDYAQEIQRASELLTAGKLLVLPTETVYGVAGVLTNSDARAALSHLRGATATKPITLHIARPADAMEFLGPVNDFARRAMRKLWPGPIGLIFDVPEEARRQTAERLGLEQSDLYDDSTLTLRCPDDPVF